MELPKKRKRLVEISTVIGLADAFEKKPLNGRNT